MYVKKSFNIGEEKKHGIYYESVVGFLIVGPPLCIRVSGLGKEQRNINEKMHFLRQIKGSRRAHKEPT